MSYRTHIKQEPERWYKPGIPNERYACIEAIPVQLPIKTAYYYRVLWGETLKTNKSVRVVLYKKTFKQIYTARRFLAAKGFRQFDDLKDSLDILHTLGKNAQI